MSRHLHVLPFSALALISLMVPTVLPAQAGTTPTYDIETYCEQISQAIGGSYQIKAQCMRDERASLIAVRVMVGVDTRMARYCDQIGQAIGGSYQIYEQCLKDEREARDEAE